MNIRENFWDIIEETNDDKDLDDILREKYEYEKGVIFDLYLSALIENEALATKKQNILIQIITNEVNKGKTIEEAEEKLSEERYDTLYENIILNEIVKGEDNYIKFLQQKTAPQIELTDIEESNYFNNSGIFYINRLMFSNEKELPYQILISPTYLRRIIDGIINSACVFGERETSKKYPNSFFKKYSEAKKFFNLDKFYIDCMKDLREKYEEDIYNEVKTLFSR